MNITLGKTNIERIANELSKLYDQKEYCSAQIAGGCVDSTNNALRIIELDASIKTAKDFLRYVGINAYIENGRVHLRDFDGREIEA